MSDKCFLLLEYTEFMKTSFNSSDKIFISILCHKEAFKLL